ncbi:hypothetical protein FB451DRAFT_1189872 [Mycena latifolia]|nr:hypothetical protein FB451DRAFT_1189872 [Mycena latifolia]
MLSTKVLVLGLAALILVRAAPSLQAPTLSCSVSVASAVGTVNVFNGIESGEYRIRSAADPNDDSPVGEEGLWKIEEWDSNVYKISNSALDVPIFVASPVLYCGVVLAPASFTMEPTGTKKNMFIVSLLTWMLKIAHTRTNEVWTDAKHWIWHRLRVAPIPNRKQGSGVVICQGVHRRRTL